MVSAISMKYFLKSATAFLLFGLIGTSAPAQTKIYSITNYGAVADGKTNNTNIIQRAIDDASA
ncbi:MAG: hypothetical protein ACXVJP_12315, partial [Mucilaginibacter sp.]